MTTRIMVKQRGMNTPTYLEHHVFESAEDARAFVKDLAKCDMRYEGSLHSSSGEMCYVFTTKNSVNNNDLYGQYQHQSSVYERENSKLFFYRGKLYSL